MFVGKLNNIDYEVVFGNFLWPYFIREIYFAGEQTGDRVGGRVVGGGGVGVNPLSPKIHIQILQADLHTFLLRIVERIWFKIKEFSPW